MSAAFPLTVADWLRHAAGHLALAPAWQGPDSAPSPRREAEWLLAAVLDRDLAWLLTWPEQVLTVADRQRAEDWLQQRQQGVPLAYLTGVREFWSLPLRVTRDTLVPRPDSERLVEVALVCCPALPGVRVLDLGTGSGALALAIRHERPDAEVTAIERGTAALAVARDNGERLGLPVRWLLGDWFAPVAGERFDIVLSNPPYLAPDDAHLMTLAHEPRSALVAAEAGLADLRHLVVSAPAALRAGGWLLLEHGADQAANVRGLLTDTGYAAVQTWQDLGGCDRVSGGQWPGGEAAHALG